MANPPQLTRRWPIALIAFWAGVAVVAVGGIGTLQYLGPPAPPPLPMSAIQHGPVVPAALQEPVLPLAASIPSAVSSMDAIGTGSTLPEGAPIAALNPALLGPSITHPYWLVPRIGPDGLSPMRAYAAAIPAIGGARVAVMVAGLGDDDAQSQAAISTLPAAISLAFTPYGAHLADTAALARSAGHEIILEIPMQGLNPATENAGDEALVMAGPITLNQPMLDWDLSQLQGYAGVTDAIGASRGAGFMNNPSAKAWLLQEIADKGLFFLDARQGSAPYAFSRNADVVIDPVSAPQDESAQLTNLAQLAKLQGNAVGILMLPSPDSVQMLQSWAQSLAAQGITLVPVSALVLPPTAQGSAPASTASVNP